MRFPQFLERGSWCGADKGWLLGLVGSRASPRPMKLCNRKLSENPFSDRYFVRFASKSFGPPDIRELEVEAFPHTPPYQSSMGKSPREMCA